MLFNPHFYYPHPKLLVIGNTISLSKNISHHIINVLRMKNHQTIILFDGKKIIFFLAKIKKVIKSIVEVEIISNKIENSESPLSIHLGQVIPTKEKINFIVQKSTELGVNIITPLFSDFSMKININHIEKKIKKWKKISISACEQCKRNIVPVIKNVITLKKWCQEEDNNLKILFDPKSKNSISIFNKNLSLKKIKILIGSESGFSKKEISMIEYYGFKNIKLGPRILRTETAALTIISIFQEKFGDLK